MFILSKHPHSNPALESLMVSHETENFEVRLYPNLGASLQEFVKNNVQIIDGITNDEAGLETYKNRYTSSWLFPFPNRISNGKYTFENNNYELDINEKALNNALHGFVFNKHFKLIEENTSEDSVFLKFHYTYTGELAGFPFPFQLNISYRITLNDIDMTMEAKNTGTSNMPFGMGWHPYFKANQFAESVLNFEAFSQYEVDNKMIPTREMQLAHELPLTLEDTFLDDCFLAKTASTTYKTDGYNLKIDFKPENEKNFIQCYTPPTRDCIAIEPMTCAPDVFNNGDGLLVLEPNESYRWQIKMSV